MALSAGRSISRFFYTSLQIFGVLRLRGLSCTVLINLHYSCSKKLTSCLVLFHITVFLFKVAAAFCESCVAGALSTNSELHYYTGKNEVYQATVQVRNPYQFELNPLEYALCSAEHLRKSYFTECLNVLWLMGIRDGTVDLPPTNMARV